MQTANIMKREMMTLTLMMAALVTGSAFVRAGSNGQAEIIPASVYGTDGRQDYFEADRMMKKFAESTVAMFADTALPKDEATGRYKLKGLTLKENTTCPQLKQTRSSWPPSPLTLPLVSSLERSRFPAPRSLRRSGST